MLVHFQNLTISIKKKISIKIFTNLMALWYRLRIDSTHNKAWFSLHLVLFYLISFYSCHFHEQVGAYPDRKYNSDKMNCWFHIWRISNNTVWIQYINCWRVSGPTLHCHEPTLFQLSYMVEDSKSLTAPGISLTITWRCSKSGVDYIVQNKSATIQQRNYLSFPFWAYRIPMILH